MASFKKRVGGGRGLTCHDSRHAAITLTVLFFANVLHRLTGIDMSTQINNLAELGAALSEGWRALSAVTLLSPVMR